MINKTGILNERDGSVAVDVIIYDKNNKQEDYKYMAKDMSGNYVIGYIVVDKPWYSNESDWTYYIVSNKYGRGFCGGASDLGFEKTIVDERTIEPYTQVAQIKYDQSIGMDVRLDKEFDVFDEMKDNTIVYIKKEDAIPIGLWSNR